MFRDRDVDGWSAGDALGDAFVAAGAFFFAGVALTGVVFSAGLAAAAFASTGFSSTAFLAVFFSAAGFSATGDAFSATKTKTD